MSGRSRAAILALAACLPSIAWGNPVAVPAIGALFPILFLLPLEGAVILFLAKASGIRAIRFVAAWTLFTTLTCIGFNAWVGKVLTLGPRSFAAQAGFMILGQLIVVVIEGAALFWFLGRDELVRDAGARPSMTRAMAVSLAVNSMSFLGSLIIWMFQISPS